MRVVVVADAVAGLSPAAASDCIARAFAERGAQVAVVPLGVTGPALREALKALAPGEGAVSPLDAAGLGSALAGEAGIIDLTASGIHGLGRESLLGFADDPRTAIAVLRERWGGRSLVALVPEGQAERPLAGLNGLAATEGRAAGADLATVLTRDAEAERWAATLGLEPDAGSGAAGGAGLIIKAVGGRIVEPLAFLAERAQLAATMAAADVVVTGAETLDFHSVGGPIVKRAVAMAGEALRPAIAIVGRNYISARELRLAGLEEAYPVRAPGDPAEVTVDGLASVSARVAATWAW